MKQYAVFYSEWKDIIPGVGSKAEAIEARQTTSAYQCFGPASLAECEKYCETHDHYRAVWDIRAANHTGA